MLRTRRALPIAFLALTLVVAATASAAPSPGWTVVFDDSFDGSEVNSALWNSDAHTGSITVSGGSLALQGGTYFPVMTTTAVAGPLYLAGEEFRTTITFRYTTTGPHGDGVTAPAFSVWQDTASGQHISIGGITVTGPVNTDLHTVVFSWDGSTYEAVLDGVSIISVASTNPPAGGDLVLGNPTECCPHNWNNLMFNRITSESMLGAPSTPAPELTTVVLLGVGMAGVASVATFRRK